MPERAFTDLGKIIPLPRGPVSFGPFRFDPLNVVLSRGDAHIHLPPRALGVLEHLIRRPGSLVSKEELLEAGWADIHVTEDALTQAISLIRQALGDDSRDPGYIETVPRLGYRFVAEISAVPRAEAGEQSEPEDSSPGVAPVVAARAPLWRRAIPWGVTALMVVIAGVAIRGTWRIPLPAPPMSRSTIPLPQTQYLPHIGGNIGLAISPDGTRLTYKGCVEGDPAQCQLYLHEFETGQSRAIGKGNHSSFSPDGRWLGLIRQGMLMKQLVRGGGPAMPLTQARWGVSLGPDDTIVFGAGLSSGLSRIPAGGGEPEALTSLDTEAGELSHRWPHILPNGKGVIFTVWSGGTAASSDIVVHSFETGERHRLTIGSHARYVPTGHMVYVRMAMGAATCTTGTLYAVPFDIDGLRITGPEVPIQDNVFFHGDVGGQAFYAISDTGKLVYAKGLSADREPVFVDFKGNPEPLKTSPGPYEGARFSPDGRRLVLMVGAFPDRLDLYELDQERQSVIGTHFTDLEGTVWQVVTGVAWHPGGQLLAISALSPNSVHEILLVSLDGSVEPGRLILSDRAQQVHGWTPDGKKALYREIYGETGSDIWEVTLDETRSTRVLVSEPGTQSQPVVSPDMRWLAYTSNHTGQAEVWVRPYGRLGRPVQASTDGGQEPIWAPDSGELYFRKGEEVLAVNIVTEPRLSAGAVRVLFEGRYYSVRDLPRAYDLSPDGEHFVMIQEGERWGTRLEVVENWFEELKRLVPTER